MKVCWLRSTCTSALKEHSIFVPHGAPHHECAFWYDRSGCRGTFETKDKDVWKVVIGTEVGNIANCTFPIRQLGYVSLENSPQNPKNARILYIIYLGTKNVEN